MSHPVTESDTFTSSVSVTDINDASYPAVEAAMGQALANRTRHLYNTVTVGGSTATNVDIFAFSGQDAVTASLTVPKLGRADLLRNMGISLHKMIRWMRERVPGTGAAASTLHWSPALIGSNSTYWGADSFSSAATPAYINQKTTDVGYALMSMPYVQPGLIFGTLTATVRSATSHGGSLPASMPRLALWSTDSAGAAAEVAGAEDASANTTAYEAMHTITVPITSTVSTSLAYHCAIRGESGSNAQANSFKLYRLSLTLWYA